MKSINPVTGEVIREYREHSPEEIATIIEYSGRAWLEWKSTSFPLRGELMKRAAILLRERKPELARLMTLEMGKIIRESIAEIEKCALVCDFYASQAEGFLQDEVISSDASHSVVAFQPLGVILAVMPWNFPFWQVFRFAAPALMAGNGALLKHASNVTGCALAIEKIFVDAGFPTNLFRTLLIPSARVPQVIDHPVIKAVTLTGSELAGSEVAAAAGRRIKKTVLELGGSDPFIVLEDCDMELTVQNALMSRLLNQGQSCIAAKRFIVRQEVVEPFTKAIQKGISRLQPGDPLDPATDTGPLARLDLAEELRRQMQESITMGAIGYPGDPPEEPSGCYFSPAILTNVKKGMPVYDEETFGPLFVIIAVNSDEEAIAVANDTLFGLGGSIWTQNAERGELLARQMETGAVFINGMVKSDPRLPFGGINKSGYGRELGRFGIREFVNVKTIWTR